MDRTERTLVAIAVFLMLASIATLIALPRVHQWERDNNYPYGKLCDIYSNCNTSLH